MNNDAISSLGSQKIKLQPDVTAHVTFYGAANAFRKTGIGEIIFACAGSAAQRMAARESREGNFVKSNTHRVCPHGVHHGRFYWSSDN